MAEPITKIKEFRLLPDPIRDWLSSTRITGFIIELNKKLGLKEEEKLRVIPIIILKLCLGEVDPKNLANEITGKLNTDAVKAQSIAQEIEEKILRPIEIPLRTQLGIDIKAIYFAPEGTAKPPLPPPVPPVRPAPPLIMRVPINKPPQSPITEKVDKQSDRL